jgi:hypothetical protein
MVFMNKNITLEQTRVAYAYVNDAPCASKQTIPVATRSFAFHRLTVVWLFTRSVYCIVKYFVKTTRLVISPQLKEAASSLKFGDYTERSLNLKSAIFPQSEKNIAKNGKATTSER